MFVKIKSNPHKLQKIRGQAFTCPLIVKVEQKDVLPIFMVVSNHRKLYYHNSIR